MSDKAWWGQIGMVPAPWTGISGHGSPVAATGIRLVCIIMFIFCITHSRNGLPVNANVSMLIYRETLKSIAAIRKPKLDLVVSSLLRRCQKLLWGSYSWSFIFAKTYFGAYIVLVLGTLYGVFG